jgi:hypothetical protein
MCHKFDALHQPGPTMRTPISHPVHANARNNILPCMNCSRGNRKTAVDGDAASGRFFMIHRKNRER